MARQHGITANTYKRFVIDAGLVYKDYGEVGQTALGATRGGNTFTLEVEQREMEVDGARGPVKGSKRRVNTIARLAINFVEFKRETFALMLPGVTVADYPSTLAKTHDQYTRNTDIADSDYFTNIAIVGNTTASGDATGSYMAIILKNVLGDGNIELAFADKEEAVPAVTFIAHFLPTDLGTEPWEIRSPIIS